jgi:diguanylate cyclase (GGDEF)-like protein
MNKKLTFYLIPLFFTILIVLLSFILPSDDLSLFNDTIYELSGNFEISLPDGSIDNTSLPANYDVDVNKTITMTRTFENDFPDMMSLRLRSSMQYMEVSIDNKLVFQDEKLDYGLLHAPEASAWHIIHLPNEVKGKTLKISISSPVKTFSGLINPIYYGDSSSLIFELISRHNKVLIPSFFLLLLGIVMLVINFFLHENADKRLYYLSLFIISTNLWLLSEMDLLQFFTGNRFLVGGISYLLITIVPVCLILYLREVVLFRYKKQLTALSTTYVVFLIVSLFLQLTGLVFFIDSLLFINAFTLISIVIVMGLLIYDYLHHKDRTAKKYIIYLSFFLSTAIIEILMFFTKNFNSISSLSSIGFIAFLTLLIFDSLSYFNEMIAKESETKLLRKLAYMDILTKGSNRAAFERDTESIINTGIKKSFRLVSADLNNLKLINDQYGHLEGDHAIVSCYNSLKNAVNDEVLCYRMGGDEFICIINETEYKYYHDFVGKVEQLIHNININKPYDIQMAMGTGIYTHNENETFEELMHKVDLQMYENKRFKKTSQN